MLVQSWDYLNPTLIPWETQYIYIYIYIYIYTWILYHMTTQIAQVVEFHLNRRQTGIRLSRIFNTMAVNDLATLEPGISTHCIYVVLPEYSHFDALPVWLQKGDNHIKQSISYTLSREYRVARNRYSGVLFTNEDRFCAKLRVQQKSTNMTSQCQYPTFQWRHRSTVVTS